jgi:hypothetical protein
MRLVSPREITKFLKRPSFTNEEEVPDKGKAPGLEEAS